MQFKRVNNTKFYTWIYSALRHSSPHLSHQNKSHHIPMFILYVYMGIKLQFCCFHCFYFCVFLLLFSIHSSISSSSSRKSEIKFLVVCVFLVCCGFVCSERGKKTIHKIRSKPLKNKNKN